MHGVAEHVDAWPLYLHMRKARRCRDSFDLVKGVHHGNLGPLRCRQVFPPAAASLRHFPDAARGTKIECLLNLQWGMPVRKRKILFAVTAFVLAVAGTVVSDAAEIKVLAAAPFKAALTEE